MNQSASTAEVMAEALHASGVERIFAYPGDPIIEFMEKTRARGIDVVLARREGTAAFMAEGHAMATGDIAGLDRAAQRHRRCASRPRPNAGDLRADRNRA
jgi:glyoxylate carboligase